MRSFVSGRARLSQFFMALWVFFMTPLSHALEPLQIKVSSTSFSEGEEIPAMYTCDGDDISPPIEWSGVPRGSKSIVVSLDDPDAPHRIWNHWYVYDISPKVAHLPEGVSGKGKLPEGSIEAINDFGKRSYGCPCPPRGTHRYIFTVRALDVEIRTAGLSRLEVERQVYDHVIAEGHLMGRYRRQ